MSKVTAPLLSFSAAGQIAKTQVYSRWKGRPYVRRYAIPSNPKTTSQMETRNVFSFLNGLWRFFPSAATAAWQAAAAARQITDRNSFIQQNLSNLRLATDLNDLVISPSALSGLPAGGVTLTAGANQVTVALTAPALPTGWTVIAAHAVAIRDQDPHTGVLYTVTYGTDTTSPYSIVLTGLVTGQVYQVGAWFSFMRDDGKTAYGIATQGQSTPT